MLILKNSKHERFAQEIASGKGGTEAYLAAGYDVGAKVASVNASRLLATAKIQTRVSELLAEREKIHGQATAKAIERVSLTKEWVLSQLVENAQRAMQAVPVNGKDGQTGEYKYDGSVANRALELLGKELGMFIDRKEQGAPGEFASLDTAEDVREAIARRLGLVGPSDAAAQISRGERGVRGKSRSLH